MQKKYISSLVSIFPSDVLKELLTLKILFCPEDAFIKRNIYLPPKICQNLFKHFKKKKIKSSKQALLL